MVILNHIALRKKRTKERDNIFFIIKENVYLTTTKLKKKVFIAKETYI